jgi:ABC-type sugar transport system substrate-binding protein
MTLYRFLLRRSRRNRLASGCAVAAGLMLLCAACSSASSTSGTATAASGSSTSASTSNCVQQADAAVSQATAPVSLPPSTGAVTGSKVAGKTFWWVGLDNGNAIAAPELAGFQAAAAALKVRVVTFDGKGNIATAIQGLSTAIAAKPAGIVIWAIDNAEANTELEQAKADHIPVVSMYELGSLTAPVTPNNTSVGQIRADVALAYTKCKMQAITFAGVGLTAAQISAAAFTKQTAALCGSCVVHAATYDATDPAGVLPEQTSNLLARYPNTNIIYTSSDAENEYYLSAIRSHGATSVKLVGQPAIAAGIEAMENGQEIGDVASPSGSFIGWQTMDQLLHMWQNGTSDQYDATVPIKLITPATLAALSNKANLFPELNAYQSAFEKRWNIAS